MDNNSSSIDYINISPEEIKTKAIEIATIDNFKRIDESREYYQNAINAYTDASLVNEIYKDNVVELWIMYAEQETELRQYKQATKVYENATNSIIGKKSVKLWIKYVEFCTFRQKYNNTKKAYIRALCSLDNENDKEQMWKHFHKFAIEHIDKTITLDKLKEQFNENINAEYTEPKNEPSNQVNLISNDQSKENDNSEILQIKMGKNIGFLQIPPFIPYHLMFPKCPYLLFDGFNETEPEMDGQVVDSLTRALANEEVFIISRNLAKEQYHKELDNLFRFQELISNQMIEGMKLYQKHQETLKGISPEIMEEFEKVRKDQAKEFYDRCKLMQQIFLSRIGNQRQEQLKKQQLTLQNLNIPLIHETTDIDQVNKQRAVVSLIIAADKLYHDEGVSDKQPEKMDNNRGLKRTGAMSPKRGSRDRRERRGRRERSRDRRTNRSVERMRKRRNEDTIVGSFSQKQSRVASVQHTFPFDKRYSKGTERHVPSFASLVQQHQQQQHNLVARQTYRNHQDVRAHNYPGVIYPVQSRQQHHYPNSLNIVPGAASMAYHIEPQMQNLHGRQDGYALSYMSTYPPTHGMPTIGIPSNGPNRDYHQTSIYHQNHAPHQDRMQINHSGAKPIDPRRQAHNYMNSIQYATGRR